MSFWGFIAELTKFGVGGQILAFILLLAALAWWIEVFMLPFHIAHISDKLDDIAKKTKPQRRRD